MTQNLIKCGYVGYTRCSSEEQGKSVSHEYQKAFIERSRYTDNIVNLGWYADTVSGSKFKDYRFEKRDNLYKAFAFFKSLVKAGHCFDKLYLLVYDTSRFGRNAYGCLHTVQEFAKIGVEVNFCELWVDYADPNYPIILNTKFAVDEVESRRISKRTKDAQHYLNTNGYFAHSVPIGYCRSDEKTIAVGKTVKQIVKDPLSKNRITAIFKDALSFSYTKTQIYNRHKDSISLAKSGLYRLLENPFYCGVYTFKGQKITGKHEPYLTQTQHEKLLVFFKSKDSKTKGKTWTLKKSDNVYYLKGLLKCSKTGVLMSAYKVKNRHGVIYHYYEVKGSSRAKQAYQKAIRVEHAHKIVEKYIGQISIKLSDLKAVIDNLKLHFERNNTVIQEQQKSLSQRKITANKRLGTISDLLADGQIDAVQFQTMHRKYSDELQEIEKKLSETTQQKDVDSEAIFTGNLSDIFTRLPNDLRVLLLNDIFPNGFCIENDMILI